MLAHLCSNATEVDSVSAQRVIGRRDLSCKGVKAIATILPLLTVLRIMSDAFLLRRSSKSEEPKLLAHSLQRCSGKVDLEMGWLFMSTVGLTGVNRTVPKSSISHV